MKPGKYTIKELLVNREVEQILIPEIQRDYIWGKEQVESLLSSLYDDFEKFNTVEVNVDADNAEIKKLFINYYKKQQCASNIGFIYAYNDAEYKGKYFLIDGQQRLTTVYLLLLALSKGNNKQVKEFKKSYFHENELKLDYKVRESSHDFLKQFLIFYLDTNFELTEDGQTVFNNKLKKQHWFYDNYINDETIQSIISNFSIICRFISNKKLLTNNYESNGVEFLDYIQNYVECWYFDTNISEQGEELYIYMNARGEQTQNSENIKADLLGALKIEDIATFSRREDYIEQVNLTGIKNFWGRKWEEWQDFFWKFKGKNENADNGFNEFLRCISGLEVYLKKTENADYKYNSIYELLTLQKIEKYILNFQWLVNNQDSFAQNYSYSKWMKKCFSEIWKQFNDDPIDWFIDYGDDNKAKELNRMAFIWPVFYYLNLKENDFKPCEVYRILRLFYVRLKNNIRAVKSIKGLVEHIVLFGIWEQNKDLIIDTVDNYLLSDDEEAKNAKIFLKEEKEKHSFLRKQLLNEQTKYEALIWEIEDHPINLIGKNLKNQNISHLIDLKKENAERELLLILNKFYQLFPLNEKGEVDELHTKTIQTLLLHFGTFKHRVGPDYLYNYEFNNWGRIVRNIDGEAFKLFFEEYKKNEFNLKEKLTKLNYEFCQSNKSKIKEFNDLKQQLIIYSIILGDNFWSFGGRIAYREWKEKDRLFVDQHGLHNLETNFSGKYKELWSIVPEAIKLQIDEDTETLNLMELTSNIYNEIH